MGATQAAAIICGCRQLVLGDEIGVTAYEVSSDGDRIRVAAADLQATARVLRDNGVEGRDFEALVVVSNAPATARYGSVHDAVAVEVLGVPDGPLAVLATLEPGICGTVLAEAAAVAWRQRLSDASDGAGQLTAADAEVLGPIAITGAPLLTELRAERRRLLAKTTAGPTGAAPHVAAALDDVIADLRASVRFGAAGLLETPEDQVAKGVASAVADGSWIQRLRLLLAAQEVAAIELVIAARHPLRGEGSNAERPSPWQQILDTLDAERNATEDLTSILDDLRTCLPAEPTHRAQRLLRKKLHDDTRTARKVIDAYTSVTQNSAPTAADDESITWSDAVDALGQLDDASAHGRAVALPVLVTSNETGDDTEDVPSIDDIASWLGEIFARQLPQSRKQLDELGRRHPGENTEATIARVKRQAIADLGHPATGDDSPPVLETVATLAMSIALLRDIEPHTETEFAELGRRILDRTQGIADMHTRAGQAIPLAVAGFERVAQQIQPVIVEALFRAMAVAAPDSAGAARDLYKNARSVVWRARHKRGIAAVAAAGAGRALQQALGSGTARLLVREVDRTLTTPKRSHLR
ncbi:hypothetical protein EEB14_35145 [Rhodococcus sp. WS4]|nr:hypothetical protein EEB14_35145 [Rhodococcus sp. WS4]